MKLHCCVCLVFLGLLLIGSITGYGAEVSGTDAATNGQAMILGFLKQEAIRRDATFLEGISNRQQWEARRAELRSEYLEMLGLWPMPERTALQPKVTGVIERDEGFRVEKLHFQSRPGLYVTGNLFMPKDAKPGAKLPGVLYVCGHSGRGRDGNKTAFQHHGMWFATHGYVCLVIDTLQLGEIAAIHHGTYRYDRWWWHALGYTPATIECWNGIRALDYLQSRPEVDPERLAVTGISGGGAATFWIAAADERVKVAVPVSGMADLEDYVGDKVVNGHCDCMFLINSFHWPWTYIAALIAPRPMLFENSGHDTIFPMTGNDRIRARLERLYGYYTNRTDRLFDIGVTPGGHDDKPELRLMAYRWINRHLKNDDTPVTEPDLPRIDGKLLRAFPDELPSDEINTKIDELFIPQAKDGLPQTAQALAPWRDGKLAELRRIVFHELPTKFAPATKIELSGSTVRSGTISSEPGIGVNWKYLPSANGARGEAWLVVLDQSESFDTKPEWLTKLDQGTDVLLVAPRGTGPTRWQDPSPFYIQRSLPLLGLTVDGGRLTDILAATAALVEGDKRQWTIAGRGGSGVIAAYAALFEPRLKAVVAVDPPRSHRDGPMFLNVLRVLDVPEALGMLAPRRLTVYTGQPTDFERTSTLYQIAGQAVNLQPLP